MTDISELRRHLAAVKQTRQITNAMYLLSTSHMKKAMRNIDYNLMYLKRLRATMKDVLSKTKRSDIHHPFIEYQEEGKTLYIAITADKGLCGSYNSDIVKLTLSKMKKRRSAMLASIGSVGSDMFISKGIEPDYTWYDILQHPSLYMARKISESVIELYTKHQVNEAYIVYTEYVNSGFQRPVCRRILPLLRRDFLDLEYEFKYESRPIYEPSVEQVFLELVPLYVSGFMYDVFMQSAASENAARMRAMQSATENADNMIALLSAEINAARQLQITNEIIEIAAATDIAGSDNTSNLKET